MNIKPLYFTLILALLMPFATLAQKELKFDNQVYEPTIKTVQINSNGNSVESVIAPPVTRVNRQQLWLSFDDLRENADYYYVYFIHCNADWTPSSIRPNVFLNTFNEFEITEFEFSSEAKQKYVNYRFAIPAFKTSGNYLAVVYRDRDKEDLILSQRFYVFEDAAAAGVSINRSADAGKRLNNQRVEVTLNYANLKAVDPKTQFKVVVKQNQREDLTTYNLPSTFIDQNNKTIRYQNLGDENEFPGTNEFRSFDLGTVTFTGRNVQSVKVVENRVFAELRPDMPLGDGYLQGLDINGQFYIRDLEGRSGQSTAEYVNTKLSLKHPQKQDNVYVLGAFNNWQKNESSLMRYNSELEQYELEVLLKQGWYNYTYVTDGQDPFSIDGSFFDTENLYEVFVYYRPMGGRGDLLVAYSATAYNSRR
ncbi:type IX secretion system plug protein domain-containing protein [uncultured Roseivirga sp.]|uniref:type IX secretion system plug protein n=1 Tax=uncultured Roseivirga sp. TaxID=543088 RepID=UPI000D7B3CBE|nr:type IX secretion system plug protein domain-containing protein [uncultured Roseivirga sp.]PWL32089.1 MAG: hypothetical protein DCO95_02595 [Roseivirga sp. XM-24bin3]